MTMRKAFTLIELLIVIAIIGILSVALLPAITGAPQRARDSARKADLRNIQQALELYALDHNGDYPGEAGPAGCDDFSTGCGSRPKGDSAFWPSGGYGLVTMQNEGYISLPVDPINNNGFFYYYEPVHDGQSQFGVRCPGSSVVTACAYILSTRLENEDDDDYDLGCAIGREENHCVTGGGAQKHASP